MSIEIVSIVNLLYVKSKQDLNLYFCFSTLSGEKNCGNEKRISPNKIVFLCFLLFLLSVSKIVDLEDR